MMTLPTQTGGEGGEMGRMRWGVVTVGLTLACLVVPSLSSADENPIDRSEYGHLSGGLTHLFAASGGGGGGPPPKATCPSPGGPAANVRANCDHAPAPGNAAPP